MSLSKIWRSLFSQAQKPLRKAKKSSKKTIEQLEDRTVPAVFTWSGSTSNNWIDPANWSLTSGTDSGLGTLGVPDTAGDSAVFDGSLSPTFFAPNAGIAIATDSITFSAGNTTNYSLSGLAITLSTAAGLNQSATGTNSIANQLLGTQPISVSAGSLTLSAANTVGATTISGGTLAIGNATSVAGVTVNAGGIFQINNVIHNNTVALNNGGSLRGSGGAAARENGIVTVANAASVTMGAAGGSTLTLSDAVNDLTGGTGSTINVTGGGTVTVTQTATLGTVASPVKWSVSGGSILSTSADLQLGLVPTAATLDIITLDNGTFRNTVAYTLSANRGFTLGSGGGTINNNNASLTAGTNLTYAGRFTGANVLNLTGPDATGALVLSTGLAAPNQATTINVLSSRYFINGTTANDLGSATVNISGGAQLGVLVQAANFSLSNPINFASGAALENRLTGATGLTLTGPVTLPTSGTVLFGNEIGAVQGITNFTNGANAAALTGTLTIQVGPGNGTGVGTVNLNHAISGGGSLVKSSTGTLVLSGTNTYTGTTTVSGGVLQFAKEVSLYNNNTAGSGWTATNIVVNSGASLGLNVGGVGEFTATDVATISGLGTGAGGFLNNSTLALDSSNGSFNYGNVLANPNGGANVLNLTKLGVNTLTLSGANTYTGKTTIANGAVSVDTLNSISGGSASSNLGAPTTLANGTINLGSNTTVAGVTGTLVYTGTGQTTDRVINLASTTGGGIIDQSGTGLLKFISAFTATGLGAKTLTLQGSSAGTGEVANAIVNSAGFTTTLVKSGSGTWTLSGNNTFTGGLTINNTGTLVLNNAGALNVAGTNTVSFGPSSTARLRLNGNNVTIAGLTTNATPGTPIVENDNGTPATLSVNNAVAGTFAGILQDGTGGGALAITKAGTATWTLSGTNTYGGLTTINDGILTITNASALGSSAAGTIINVNGVTGGTGPTLDLQNNINVPSEPITLNSNTTGDRRTSITNTSGTNTYGGPIILQGSGTIQFNSIAGVFNVSGTVTGNSYTGSFFPRGAGSGTITSSAVINLGSGNFGKTDAGTWTINSTGNSWNNTNVAVGTLKMGAVNAIPATTTLSIGQAAQTSTLDLNGFSQTVAGIVVTAGTSETITSASAATLTLNNASSVTYNNGATFGAVLSVTHTGSAAFSIVGTGATSNGSTGTLTASGTGLLTLGAGFAADSGWRGAVTINNGSTVVLAQANLIANNSLLTANTGGTFDMSGFAETVGLIAGAGNINNNNAGLSLAGTTGGGSQTFSGSIAGSGGLTQTGATSTNITETLTGSSSYSGPTVIQAGTLSINSLASVGGGNSALGAPTTALAGTIALGSAANTGTLIYTGSATTTDRVIDLAGTTGGATLDQSGTGLLSFTSAFTASGSGAKTLSLQGTASGQIANTIVNSSGTTAVTKAGAGSWTLSGANSYTGATTLNAGTLFINGSTAAASAVAVNSGAVLGGNGTVNGSLTVNSGGILDAGATPSAPGTFNTASNTVSLASGTLRIQIVGGTGTDLLSSGGVITLGGPLAGSFSGASSPGTPYIIVSSTGSITAGSTFSGLTNNSTIVLNGESFVVTYDYTVGASKVTLTDAGVTGAAGTVYVNDNWSNPTPGADPDGAGPATQYGIDSFSTIQSAIDALPVGGGTIIVEGNLTGAAYPAFNVNKASVQFQFAQDTNIGAETAVFVGAMTLTNAPSFANVTGPLTGATGVSFNSTINGAQALNFTGSAVPVTFAGIIGGTTPLTSLTTSSTSTSTMINSGATAITTTGAQTYNVPLNVGVGTNLTGSALTTSSISLGATLSTTISDSSTIGGAITSSGAFGISLLGSGTTTLSGSNTYTGSTIVRAGVLSVPTGVSITATNLLDIGGPTGAVLSVTGGTVTTTGAPRIGMAQTGNATSIGTLYLSAGAVNAAADTTIGFVSTGGTTATGFFYQSGGAFTQTGGDFYISVKNVAGTVNGTYSISGGTMTSAAGKTFLVGGGGSVAGAIATLNVDGGSVTAVNILNGTNAGAGTSINLGGGTLITPAWTNTSATNTTLNFHGGTLRASNASATFLGSLTNPINLYTGGGTVDTQGNAITLNQVIRNPASSSLTGFGVSGGTTVYASPPSLIFAGGTGAGAAGYATLDSTGKVNGVIITNVGSYTVAPTFSIAGFDGTYTQPTLTPNSTGSLTKLGSAALTLSGVNTFNGGLNIKAGTVVASTSASALGGSGTGTVNLGDAAGSTAAAVLVATTGLSYANPIVLGGTSGLLTIGNTGAAISTTYSGGVTGSNSFTINTNATTGTITFSTGSISNVGTVTAIGAGTGTTTINSVIGTTVTGVVQNSSTAALSLTGLNTYTGTTTITAGTLIANTLDNGGNPSSIGASTNAASNLVLNGGTLRYNGASAALTDRNFQLNTAGGGLDNSSPLATSTLTINGSMTLSGSGARTLTLTGSNTGNNPINFAITDQGGATSLTKSGAGTWLMNGSSNTYTGTTTIANGTLISGANNALGTSALVFGSGATAGALDLTNFNQSITTLDVLSTSGSVTNIITIGSGKTLTSSGNVTIGQNATATAKLTVSGASAGVGTWTANNTAASGVFTLGNASVGSVSNSAILDMSSLGTFTANLSGATSTFRVGDPTNSTGTTTTSGSTLILAQNSTITAAKLTSDSLDSGLTQAIKLGSGTNIINATTIEIGSGPSGRANGTIDFNASTGTLKIRAQDTTSSATVMTVAYGATATGANPSSTVNFNGHSVDLLITTLQIAGRTGATGANASGSFSFDTGTIGVSTIDIARRVSNASTSFGTLTMGGGTLNVSGNISLANASVAGGTANGTLNLNGGTLNLTGNLTQTGGAGTNSSTVNFNGGTLRAGASNATWMQGLTSANVQAGGAFINTNGFNVTIAQPLLAAGGGLTKSGTGTLTLTGASTYNGATNVNAGILLVNTATFASAVTVNSGGALGGNGTVAGVTLSSGGVLDPGSPIGTIGMLTSTATNAFNLNSTYSIQLTGGTTTSDLFTSPANITLAGVLSGAFTPTASSGPYTIVSATGGATISGTFIGTSDGSTIVIGGENFTINYVDTNADTFADKVTLTDQGTQPAPSTVYVNDDWSDTTFGNDPDGASGAVVAAYGTTAFSDIQSAINYVSAGSTIVIEGGTYTLPVNISKALTFQFIVDTVTVPNQSGQTTVNINAGVSVTAAATFTNAGGGFTVAAASFGSTIDGAGSMDFSGTSSNLTFAGSVGNTTPLTSFSSSSGTTTVNSAVIKTTGSQVYNGPLVAGANLTISTTSNGSLTFNNTVLPDVPVTTTPRDLTLSANGTGTVSLANSLGTAGLSWHALAITGANVNSTGGIAYNGTGGTLSITNTGTASTLSGVISGSGTFTKLGAGTLTLSGANTFSGTLVISAGGLKLGANDVIPDGTGKGDVTVTGTLDLNGFSDTVNGLSGAGVVDDVAGGGASTLTAGNINITSTFSGTLKNTTGTLNLTKIGTGTLTLSGTNSYKGVTTISGGAISAAADLNFGAVPGSPTPGSIVLDGGAINASAAFTLNVNRGIAITNNGGTINDTSASNFQIDGIIANTPSHVGTLTISNSGAGIYVPNAQSTYSGGTFFNAGGGSSQTVPLVSSTGPAGAPTSGPYGTGTITLNGGQFRATSAAAITLANNINFQVDTIIPTAGSTLTLSGTISMIGGTRTLTDNSANNVILSGAISDGGNNYGFIKAGTGLLALSGTNTYAGTTTISGGTLQIGNGGTSGSINTNNVVDNATLAFNRTDSITFSNLISGTGALTQSGTGTTVLTGANTYTGKTTVANGALSVSTLNSVTGGSASSNLGAPTTAANGTIALGNSATVGRLIYTGTGETTDRVIDLAGTTFGGVLDQSGTGSLIFATAFTATGAGIKILTLTGSTAGTGTINNAILNNSGTNTTAVTKAGTSTWTLANTTSPANLYTGVTSVSAGTLVVTGSTGLGSTTGGTTITSGATLDVQANIGAEAITSVTGTGVGGIGAIINSTGAGTIGGAVTLITPGASVGGAGNLTINGAIGGATFTLTKVGSGTVSLGGPNTYSGATTISAGTLRSLANNVLPDTSAINVSSNGAGVTALLDLNGFNDTITSLTFAGATTTSTANVQTGAGTLTLAGNITYTSTNNPLGSTLSGNLSLGGATRTISVGDSTSATNDLTISANIIGTGAEGLIKTGAGLLDLSGSNTYSGATIVMAGTLKAEGGNGIPDNSQLNLANQGGVALLLGGNETIGSLTGGGPTGGTIDLSTFTLSVGNNNADSVYAGSISGAGGGLTKVGTGTLTLGGTGNSFTGPVNVNTGKLALDVVPTGAAGYYSFDSVAGNTVTNQGTLGTAKNGTFTNSATTTPGLLGNGMKVAAAPLQTSTGYMGITGNIPAGTGAAWTASAWFNTPFGTAQYRTLFRSSTADHQIIINTGTTNLGEFVSVFSPSGFDVAVGNNPIGVGAVTSGWHQVTAVGNAGVSTTSMYVDGVLVGTVAAKTVNDIFAVGNYQGSAQPFANAIDEVYIYQSSLTAAQIQALYAASLAAPTVSLLPDGARVNVSGTGTLDLNGRNETIGSLAGAGSVLLGAGTLTVGADNTTTADFGGGVSGTGGLTKTGTGTQTLSSTNSYSGATNVNTGTLLVNGALTGVGAVNVTGTLAGSGSINGSVAINASGVLNPGAVGGVGVLTVNNNVAFNASSTMTIDVNASSVDKLVLTAGTVTFSGSPRTLSANYIAAVPVGTKVTIIDLPSAASAIAVGSGFTNALAQSGTVALGTRSYAYTYTDNGGTGSNDLALTSAPNTVVWSGLSGVDDNWSRDANWTSNLAPTSGDNLTFDNTGVGNRPNPNNDTNLPYTTITLNNSANSYNLLGNAVTLSTGLTDSSSGTASNTVTLVLAGSGAALTKSGSATLILSGVNTYGGNSTIGAGTLKLGASGVIPDGAGKGNVTVNGTLDLAGFDEIVNGLTGSGTVDNSVAGGPYTFTVGANDQTSIFAGAIQNTAGTVALTKTGIGTLTLSGTNSYAGSTIVSAGTLQIGNAGTTGTLGFGSVTDNATLIFNRSNGISVGNIIGGSGVLTQAGAGTLTLTGNNTYDGLTTVSAGVLAVGHDSALGSTVGGTTVSSGGQLQLTGGRAVGAEALTFNGTGGGSGAVNNTGINSFAGAITVQSASSIVVTSGTLTLNSTVEGPGGLTADTGASVSNVLTFNGTLGNATPLAAFTSQGSGTTNINAGLVNTTGNQAYNNAVVLGTATNLTASAGAISETGGSLTGGSLTTSSVGGTTLSGANQINTFFATNTGSGNVTLNNTAPTLTLAGISQSGGGLVAVVNTGDINISAGISAGSGAAVNLSSTGLLTEFGPGLVNTTGTLTTSSSGGTALGGANTVGGFSASNTTSGNISLINTANPLSLSTVTQTGGNVIINNTGAISLTGLVSAGAGNVNLTSSTTITDSVNDTVTDISGNVITLTAVSGIGTAGNALDTAAITLNASVSGVGLINLYEANSVSLASATTTNGNISVLNAAGDMTLGTGAVIAGSGGNVTLTASAGTIKDNANDSLTDITGNLVTLTAQNGVGESAGNGSIDTAANTLSASVTGAGLINLNELDAVTLSSVITVNGPIDVIAGGTITVNTVTAGTSSAANLTASSGNIIDDGNNATLITGGAVNLSAGNGSLGVSGATGQLDLQAVTLVTDTSTSNGNQFLAETDTVSIGSGGLHAGTGNVNLGQLGGSAIYTLTSGTSINDNTGVNLQDGATLTLDAAGETIGSLGDYTGFTPTLFTANVNLNGAALTVGSNNNSTTYSGVVTGGAGTLTKVGTGTLTEAGSGPNTYSGLTTVSAGTLALAKTSGGDRAIFGSANIDNGGTLSVRADEQISTFGIVTVNTGGVFSVGTTPVATTFTETVNPIDFGSSGAGGTVTVLPTATLATTGDQNQIRGEILLQGTSLANSGTFFVGGANNVYTLNAAAARLTGTGIVKGNVNNTNGIIDPGYNASSPLAQLGLVAGVGTLSIASVEAVLPTNTAPSRGKYTQGANGTLKVDYGTSSADLLTIAGTAFLDGTLDAAAYSGSGNVPVLTWATAPYYNNSFGSSAARRLTGVTNPALAPIAPNLPSDFAVKNLNGNLETRYTPTALVSGTFLNPEVNANTLSLVRGSNTGSDALPNLAVTATSGFVVNGTVATQTITVKNNGAAITTPIYLEIYQYGAITLPTLTNRQGLTKFSANPGRQYLLVSPTGLATGASTTVQLKFYKPSLSFQIAYNKRFFGNGLAP